MPRRPADLGGGPRTARRLRPEDLLALRSLLPEGPEAWWPAASPFEVAVGAILVQGVTWANAARAVGALAARGLLAPVALAGADAAIVAEAIRPALYFNQKTRYLQALAGYTQAALGGEFEALQALPPPLQRLRLQSLPGIGPETASAIMVYALGTAESVVDAYALRIARRTGIVAPEDGAAQCRAVLDRLIAGSRARSRLLHAALVELGRTVCRPRPRCGACPLKARCPTAAAADGRLGSGS